MRFWKYFLFNDITNSIIKDNFSYLELPIKSVKNEKLMKKFIILWDEICIKHSIWIDWA